MRFVNDVFRNGHRGVFMNRTTVIGVAGLVLLSFFSSSAWADAVRTQTELAMLPSYCSGVQQVRDISRDPVSLDQYMQMYGPSYGHFHHYCWALNSENNANAMFNKSAHDFELGNALNDIQYVLKNSSPDFVFLPDVYNSQARILFSLHRDSEAVLALEKAIELKPGYAPAVSRLSDYFAHIGDKGKAIKTLETGIDNTENAGGLIKKLSALGVTYQGKPGSAIKKDEPVNDVLPTASPDAASPSSAVDAAPVGSKPANNPYCRFCP